MRDVASRAPHVIWDMTFTLHTLTGTRVYAHNMYRALAARGEMRMEEIYAPNTAGGIPGAQNVWWLARGLEKKLNARKPDLFHVAAYLGPRRAPCPVIVNVFDVAYVQYAEFFDWKWRAYARWVIPHTVQHAAAVVTLTEHARQEIIKAYSVDPARVHIVAPGVGSEFRMQDDAAVSEMRAKYNLGKNYLLYVGAPHERKNIPALINAFALLRHEFADLILVLAGPQMPEAEHITRAVNASGAANAVQRFGYIPQNDLPRLYAGARAFVYASKVEGFGMPPVEAMACGTPVVSAPNAPMPDVLGDAGYFARDDSPAALARAMGDVLRDDALAAQLRARGMARAREFTWERAARDMQKIYADVLMAQSRVTV